MSVEAELSWLERFLLLMAGEHLALNWQGMCLTLPESAPLMKDFHILNCVSPRRTPRQRSFFSLLLVDNISNQENFLFTCVSLTQLFIFLISRFCFLVAEIIVKCAKMNRRMFSCQLPFLLDFISVKLRTFYFLLW